MVLVCCLGSPIHVRSTFILRSERLKKPTVFKIGLGLKYNQVKLISLQLLFETKTIGLHIVSLVRSN